MWSFKGDNGWVPYSSQDNERIEKAVAKKVKVLNLNATYKLDFSLNRQIRIDDNNRWRAIRKEPVGGTTSTNSTPKKAARRQADDDDDDDGGDDDDDNDDDDEEYDDDDDDGKARKKRKTTKTSPAKKAAAPRNPNTSGVQPVKASSSDADTHAAVIASLKQQYEDELNGMQETMKAEVQQITAKLATEKARADRLAAETVTLKAQVASVTASAANAEQTGKQAESRVAAAEKRAVEAEKMATSLRSQLESIRSLLGGGGAVGGGGGVGFGGSGKAPTESVDMSLASVQPTSTKSGGMSEDAMYDDSDDTTSADKDGGNNYAEADATQVLPDSDLAVLEESPFTMTLDRHLIAAKPDAKPSIIARSICALSGNRLAIGYESGNVDVFVLSSQTILFTLTNTVTADTTTSSASSAAEDDDDLRISTSPAVLSLCALSQQRIAVGQGKILTIFSLTSRQKVTSTTFSLRSYITAITPQTIYNNNMIMIGLSGKLSIINVYNLNNNILTFSYKLETNSNENTSNEVRSIIQLKQRNNDNNNNNHIIRILVGGCSSLQHEKDSLERGSIELFTITSTTPTSGFKIKRSLLSCDIPISPAIGLRCNALCPINIDTSTSINNNNNNNGDYIIAAFEYCSTGDRQLSLIHIPELINNEKDRLIDIEKRCKPLTTENTYTAICVTGGTVNNQKYICALTWAGQMIIYEKVNTSDKSIIIFKKDLIQYAHDETIKEEGSKAISVEDNKIVTVGGAGDVKIWY